MRARTIGFRMCTIAPPVNTLRPAAAVGYIAARSSRVSRATTKGFGVGLAVGIAASVACVLALMWDEFLAAAIMAAALGTVTTWFVVRRMFPRDSGD